MTDYGIKAAPVIYRSRPLTRREKLAKLWAAIVWRTNVLLGRPFR